MALRLIQVDAFTATPYAGNPAAVCLLDPPRDDAWLQAVAAEMNLAETAFLWRRADGFALRWFTPTVEVPLCGHATLASAHALWETATAAPRSRASTPPAASCAPGVTASGSASTFPPARPSGAAVPVAVCAALGAEAVATATNQTCHVVELASEAAVRALAPDMRALAAASPEVGVAVTARASAPPYDIVSRFFAPAHGIDEDPVTGGAHCALGPYWAPRLGKRTLLAYQASRRGGTHARRRRADARPRAPVRPGGDGAERRVGELADEGRR